MRTLEVGEALDKITRHVGHLPGETWAIDPEQGVAYPYRDWTDVFDMQQSVYVRSLDWVKEGQNSHVWVLLRLNQHPLIVFHPSTQSSARSVPQTAVITLLDTEAETSDGHRFDPLDLVWTCKCGSANDPDQEECAECGANNPFLGVFI